MRAYIVVATKGRAAETLRLVEYLQRQTKQPEFVVVAGTETRDIESVTDHPWLTSGRGKAFVSPKIGSSAQRNVAIEYLEQRGCLVPEQGPSFCAFFDDDYRPAHDWLQRAEERFAKGDIAGLTGLVLADGIRTGGLTEDRATAFLSGAEPPQPHWASGSGERETDLAYGCNMAFRDTVVRNNRFDENLPLYGLQEDRDYTARAKQFGRVIYYSECCGVHLGTQRGRTSGVTLGYSQIANMLYLIKKGTVGYKTGLKHIGRNIAANTLRGVLNNHPHIDYRGRFCGNLCAVFDVLTMRLHPLNILSMGPKHHSVSPKVSKQHYLGSL